jgi:thiol-disulfide isomerase/thioredoxin
MRLKTVTTLVAGAVLVLTGCSAGSAETGGDGAAGGGSSTSGTTAAAADLAFTAEGLDGSSFDGEMLAGRPAVLWFWAPWCPTCRAQAPGVSRLAEQYDGQVSVVGVGGLADAGDIRDFAEQVDGPTHLVDPDGEVWRHFGVTAQSTYLVLDADGGVVAEGYLDDHVLTDEVEGLVD